MGKKNLVIVESPAKAKTIGKYLGPDYQVKASMGHVRDLPKSTLGVDIDNHFEAHYINIRGKGEIIKEINREGITVMLIEQNANKALAISDHAYIMQTGEVVKYGTGAELLADENLSAMYLGE